jgi:hypothetical protein
MAITTTTVYVAGGAINWLPSDVIVGIESAFTWLGWHSSQVTGIVTGISAVSGGGTITGSAYTYENNGSGNSFYYSDVPQSSSSGIGTGASFSIRRYSGGAFPGNGNNLIYVNRPGYGYTTGEVIQISAVDIGGSANGAIGIAVTVNISAVGYGTTNAFFAKDLSGGISGTPWGVLKLEHQAGKKYGNTYYGFQVVNYNSNYTSYGNPTGFALKFASGSDFHPYNVTNTNSLGIGYSNRFCGNGLDDGVISPNNTPPTFSQLQLNSNDGYSAVASRSYKFRSQFASSLNYPLNINIYRSAIDTNFAVISFAQPGITAAQLSSNSFTTFFIHKYSSTLWDLDNVFLEGITQIVGETGNSITPAVRFTSWIGGNSYTGDYNSYSKRAWRAAEAGYMIPGASGSKEYQLTSRYTSTTYLKAYSTSIEGDISASSSNVRIYNRNSSDINQSAKLGTAINYASDGESSQSVTSSANYNAVIKGIPLSAVMVPSPYYLPDDFVFIDFSSATDQQIIQQGDTVTVSGGEVYTVITGSYNQTTRTRGILFCARKV